MTIHGKIGTIHPKEKIESHLNIYAKYFKVKKQNKN